MTTPSLELVSQLDLLNQVNEYFFQTSRTHTKNILTKYITTTVAVTKRQFAEPLPNKNLHTRTKKYPIHFGQINTRLVLIFWNAFKVNVGEVYALVFVEMNEQIMKKMIRDDLTA